jgi:hypothetical protein
MSPINAVTKFLVRGGALIAGAAMLPALAMAEGFKTCSIPQRDITTKSGVERPLSRAYDNVCAAVLPPTCRDYTVNGKPCAYRACLVMDNLRSCPNGEPPAYTAVTIQPYVARPARRFTAEEFAAMNHAIDAEAKRLAAKWTDNGRVPLSPGALTVLGNISCQLAAAGNPDVRCVPR